MYHLQNKTPNLNPPQPNRGWALGGINLNFTCLNFVPLSSQSSLLRIQGWLMDIFYTLDKPSAIDIQQIYASVSGVDWWIIYTAVQRGMQRNGLFVHIYLSAT